MDLNKLSLGDKIIAVSGILLLIFSFFPWLGFSYLSLLGLGQRVEVHAVLAGGDPWRRLRRLRRPQDARRRSFRSSAP